jgi:hypothetical protein
MKIHILIFLIMFMLPIAYAEVNSSIPIIAEFKINSIYTDSDAKISILNPDGDSVLSDIAMNEISKGMFNYNFLCNSTTGEYKATVIFYNKSTSADIGSDTSNFNCVDDTKLDILSCPSSDIGIIGMWIFLIILIIVGVAGAMINSSALSLLSGAILFFYSITTWGCGSMISYLSIGLGIIFMGIGLTMRR